MTELSDEQKRDFEAAAFRRLVAHLRERGDVQNIDLTNLDGSAELPVQLVSRDGASRGRRPQQGSVARIVYRTPYAEGEALNQSEASDAKKAEFEARRPKDH